MVWLVKMVDDEMVLAHQKLKMLKVKEPDAMILIVLVIGPTLPYLLKEKPTV